jgi:hypothetical protein
VKNEDDYVDSGEFCKIITGIISRCVVVDPGFGTKLITSVGTCKYVLALSTG